MRTGNKFVLWAGPDDGREAVINPGQYQFRIPGPPRLPDHPGEIREDGETPMTQGVYEYNSVTQRFEWKGYE